MVWCGCQHPGTALKGVPGPILEDSRDCVRCMRVAVLGLRRGWVGWWGHLGHVNASYLHEGLRVSPHVFGLQGYGVTGNAKKGPSASGAAVQSE